MKLTFFLGGLSGGGAERVVCNLANYFVSHNHNVDILTIGDDDDYGLDHHVKRVVLLQRQERKNTAIDNVKRIFRFSKYLIKNKRDAFIVMMPTPTIMLLRFKFLVKGSIIASERNYPSAYSLRTQNQLRKLAKRTDAWVFQTETNMQWYKPWLGESQSIIIPNPINAKFIRPAEIIKRTPKIITVGRFTKQKNHALLIKAFAKINPKYPDTSLIIYGDGSLHSELEQLATSLGVMDKVSFPGFSPWGELSHDASLFVLSSDFEGMPNALMEAMALGMPCISTDCDGGGARFLIEDGVNGLLVPKNDVDAMAMAMHKLLSNPDMASQLGMEAHRICERLAPEKIYKEWENYIIQIVSNDINN